MKRLRHIVIAILLAGTASAQEFDAALYLARDSIIQNRVNAGNYEAALPLLNSQIEYLIRTDRRDSIYNYTYNTARSEWKVFGADRGIKRMKDFVQTVTENDTDTLHLLSVWTDLSWIYYETGRTENCVEADTRFMEIASEYSEATTELKSKAFYNLGFDYLTLGKGKKAAEYFRLALVPLEEDGYTDVTRTVDTYNALGASLLRVGDFAGAKAAFRSSLEYIEQMEDPYKIYGNKANCYNNLALIAHSEGQMVTAKDYFEKTAKLRKRALDVAEESRNSDQQRSFLMTCYRNLGSMYITIGDYARAERIFQYIRNVNQNIYPADHPNVFSSYETFGTIYMITGELEKAQENFESYAAHVIDHYGTESYYTATAYLHLGEVAAEKGDWAKAIASMTDAIELTQKISSETNSQDLPGLYFQRSDAYAGKERWDSARLDILEAIKIIEATREATDPTLANARIKIAELDLKEGKSESAKKHADKALEILHAHNAEQRKLPGDLGRFSPFLPKAYLIRARVEAPEKATAGELSRSAAFLNLGISVLRKSRNLLIGEESQVTLYDSHREIFDMAREICYRRYLATDNEQFIDTMFRLSEESRSLMIRHQLNQFTSVRFNNIPDSVIDKERRLIDLLTGGEDSNPEFIDIDSLETEYEDLMAYIENEYPEYYHLRHAENQAGIETVQRELLDENKVLIEYISTGESLYALVISQNSKSLRQLGASNLDKKINAYNRAIIERDSETYEPLSQELYRKLYAPLREEITGQELLIVPDGPLFRLNFETLQSENGEYLLKSKTISYLLSSLTGLEYENLQAYSEGVLAVAPGFSDELKRNYEANKSDSAFYDPGYLRLIQQPFAVKTARNIANIFPGKVFVAEAATETNFKREANRHAIIYLGTHAEINNRSPLLSKLILSKSQTGYADDDDGFLHAYEIYGMTLPSELVILTACETGSGKESSSEGVISLAHSFAYAGCPSIVMSLWKIDEKTSAQITETFVRNLSRGMDKNGALRAAKLEFMESASPELRKPYYWAGMVLLGDNEAIANTSEFPWLWCFAAGIAVVFLFILLYRFRRSRTT